MINGQCGAMSFKEIKLEKMNYFEKDLDYSYIDDKYLDSFYKSLFPHLTKIEFVTDLETQKKGIDKILHFENGGTVTIDEKKRRSEYNDILLEVWSVYEQKKLGWLYTSRCDYMVYIFMNSCRLYLLPMPLVKVVWNSNEKEWMSKYRKIKANNEGYVTISYAIPIDILLNSISNTMFHHLKRS